MPTELSLPQFSAAICIEGLPAEIWAPVYYPANERVEGWIASEAGKQYSVCWRRKGDTGCDVGGVAIIDGHQIGGTSRIVPRGAMGWNEYSGKQTSAVTERPFKFGEVQTTDDERLLIHQQLPPRPGEIVLEIYRVAIVSQAHRVTPSSSSLLKSNIIHERSKKGGFHMTSLGSERRARPCSSVLVVPLTPLDVVPCATFVFRYRPAGILRAAGIMPPLAEAPLYLASRIEEDDQDDIDQAEAEIAALQNTLKARIIELAKRKRVNVEDVEADISAKKRRVHV
ncbi:hypothetical protein FRC04_010827 [Tulasnella sp. 424]|nr:hypothetical protein FRC04_010827 [Tulasnella sp. 424]KAG8972249.1 hypothetical protein FRC05_010192 [Tulasnella sp. 425]